MSRNQTEQKIIESVGNMVYEDRIQVLSKLKGMNVKVIEGGDGSRVNLSALTNSHIKLLYKFVNGLLKKVNE